MVAAVTTWRVEPEYGIRDCDLLAALLYATTGIIRLIAHWRANR